jgi:hypothetical protein
MQKDWQSDPHVFVHADDIKTHEQFFNFTKQFLLFKQDKLVSVLTCKHTNILFSFSFLFFRYSHMITFVLQNW